MDYISLYRKYRPSTFSDVVGQKIIVNTLINSIKCNMIHHAYIFSGPRGTGKTSIAKIFAKAVNCNDFKEDLCGKCNVCLNKQENEIDIVEIDAASNNSVDDIREIVNNVKIMPSDLKYKIYIIDEVHMLSNSAFNALLKTLEEPPKHAIFILATTEINKIPITVLSRCQKFIFKKIDSDSILKRLNYILKEENKELDKTVLELIANLSDGCLRDAINLLDQAISIDKDIITVDDIYNLIGSINDSEIFELLEYIFNGNIEKTLDKINYLFEKNRDLKIIVDIIETKIKDIILFNYVDDYFSKEYENKLMKFSKIDINKLFETSQIIIDLSYNLKRDQNQKNIFEIYILKIIMLFKSKSNNEGDSSISDNKMDISEKIETIVEKEYKDILINNALSTANKKLKDDFINKFKLDDYIINKKYNNIVNLLSRSLIEVVGEKNIIFTFKNESDIMLFDKNEDNIIELLNIVFKRKYDIVAISENQWLEIKNNYIKNIKNGVKYNYIDIEKKKKEKLNSTELENNVEKIFGDDLLTKI